MINDVNIYDYYGYKHYVLQIIFPKVAEELGKEDITNLLAQRKLVLLVDLDQTLIHTTNDNIPPNLKVSNIMFIFVVTNIRKE